MLTTTELRAWQRLLEPLRRRLRLLVQRAVLKGLQAQNGRLSAQVIGAGGEPLDAELVQPFGLASHPVSGASCIVLSLNGDRSHSLAINVGDSRYRVDVGAGEVALYSQEGAKVHLRAGRIIDIEGDQINLKAPVVCTDTLIVNGVEIGGHGHNTPAGPSGPPQPAP